MSKYRVGGHWAVTIVREGAGQIDSYGRRPDDELVAVVVDGDRKLARRIADLLAQDEGS